MKVKLIGHYVDPYTWELKKLNTIINIDSVKSAITWAKQSYFKTTIHKAKRIKK